VIRPVLLLAGATALLGALDLALVRHEARQASVEGRAGALLPPDRAADVRAQPFLRIRMGGTTHRYGRVEGTWRCLSAFDAPADARAIAGLLDGLAGAEGFVVARGTDAATRYGINTPTTIEIAVEGPRALQSPGGDPVATFDVGSGLPGRDEAYVRVRGTPEVWVIGSNPRALLEERPAPDLPPLLPRSAIPDAWRVEAGGIDHLALVVDGAEAWRLVRTPVVLDPERPPVSGRPWTWQLERGGQGTDCDDERAETFVRLVDSLPYVGLLDPARRAELAPRTPSVSLRLTGRTGPALDLTLHEALANGLVPLTVEDDGPIVLLEAGVAEGLVPPPESLLASEEAPR
jgi:hypothetical protein